jgi:hypothetical protein
MTRTIEDVLPPELAIIKKPFLFTAARTTTTTLPKVIDRNICSNVFFVTFEKRNCFGDPC